VVGNAGGELKPHEWPGRRAFSNPTRPQAGVRTLGALSQELTGVLDESWRLHLSNFLTDELGYNLRNLVLHGLTPRVERIEAALMVNVACYLRLLRLKGSKAPSG
jgi:hypothetical protein